MDLYSLMKRKGKSVLVIDKRPNIDENVYTESAKRINVRKYGALIFNTDNKMFWNYIADFNQFTNSPVASNKGRYSLIFNIYTLVDNFSNGMKRLLSGTPRSSGNSSAKTCLRLL